MSLPLAKKLKQTAQNARFATKPFQNLTDPIFSTDHVTFPCPLFYNMNKSVEGFCLEYVTERGYVARTICEPVSSDSGKHLKNK